MTKIMVVDNNKDVCNIFTDSLRCAGYDVECLTNEENAVAKICKEQPDLVLLDIIMPKVNGLHLLDMILKDPCNKKTEVVMLTEVSDSRIRDEALKHGAKDYIIKSETSISELLRKIDKVLSR